MTGVEALQALRDGKRVRYARWLPGTYAIVVDSRVIICRYKDEKLHGKPTIDDLLHDDWEMVESERSKDQ